MSPELETLDQLSGGDMSPAIIRTVYPDEATFLNGILGLLTCGDVQLLIEGSVVPAWRWRELLGDSSALNGAKLRITDQGARRIA